MWTATNAQITDVHSFSSNFVNEVRLGYTNQLNFFVGQSFGGGYPAKIGLQYAKADGFPSTNLHNFLQLAPGVNADLQRTCVRPLRCCHADPAVVMFFTSVAKFLINEDNSTAWGNLVPGNFGFTGDYTKGSFEDKNSGLAYADFLSGQTHDWSAQVQPEYAGRQKTPQIFIQDDFRDPAELNLNLGLRYQVQLGWKDAKNDQATFDPTIQNSRLKFVGRYLVCSKQDKRPDGSATEQVQHCLPRVGFAYTVRPDTVVRGGFGMYSYDWSLDQYGQGARSRDYLNGNAATPAMDLHL